MQQKRRLAALCVLTSILAFSAHAFGRQISLKEYRQSRSDPGAQGEMKGEMMKLYVMGLGDALVAANVYGPGSRSRNFFCPPPELALVVNNYMQILDAQIQREIQRDKLRRSGVLTDDLPISLILLHGLKETFPCPEKP